MSNRLILVPTQLEYDHIMAACDRPRRRQPTEIQLCGFGIVAAAARTATLLSQRRPDSVLLLGIAGGLSSRAPVGSCAEFSTVRCEGIGVGRSDQFQSASDLGWMQWPGSDESPPIGDVIRLAADTEQGSVELLTVCAASSSPLEAQTRRKVSPDAIAEDMEGFGVALACQLHDVPLTIIRGISNAAGDRDHSQWQIRDSLEAAVRLAVEKEFIV